MTTIRVRDIIDVAGTDHAHARSESTPTALDILSRGAGTTTAAADATKVIDMTDAHSVLRERETNGGRLPGEQSTSRVGETDEDEVIDMTDAHVQMAERAVKAGRTR